MTWVIGDVHGEKGLFLKILDKIDEEERCYICGERRKENKHGGFCSRRGWDAIYSVGDIIDRGPDPLGCVDICIDRHIRVVKGNHEDMALDFFFLEGRYEEGIWESNGGIATFNQIHELIQKEKDDDAAEKKAKKYIDWMLSLSMYETMNYNEKFLICHAGVCDDIERACKGPQPEILWRRDKIRHKEYFQIVGHSVVRKGPMIMDNHNYRYANIDTGACFTGRLSAIHLPDKKTITVSG